MQVPIEVSARHVHLCKADVEKLFGPGHKLTHKRDLSQTGEFLSEERVTLRGPKGEMKNVAVLGPERSATQVELSLSDARTLGVEIPLRLSGDLSGAADVTIISPSCELNARACAIAALSHIHLTPEDAQEMGLKDKQLVSVEVDGDRPVTFRNVVVRVKPSFRKFMHIDFDEANAAHIGKSAAGRVRPQN
ncbi:MAG: phosphate propanoyltransferase [Oscillospiraceae bacterium]|nr:phosphate propanoyltransferase [Oscillospiraceae bacterium]